MSNTPILERLDAIKKASLSPAETFEAQLGAIFTTFAETYGRAQLVESLAEIGPQLERNPT